MKIKRVLFILGVTAAVASSFAGYLRVNEVHTFCAALLLLAGIFIILKIKFSSLKWFAAVCVCAAIFLALGCSFKTNKIAPIERLSGNSAIVYGYLYKAPNSGGGYQNLFIQTESISLKGAPQKIKLSISTPIVDTYEAGDYIKAEVEFRAMNAAYKNSYYADGIYISANSYNVDHCETEQKLTLQVFGAKLSGIIKNKLSLLFPKGTVGLLNGLLVGDISRMADKTHSNFVGSGMIHLVCVSGLHLSIIAGTLYTVLKRLNKGAAALISAVAVVIIMAVTGFTESTLRAGIMFFIMLLAGLSSRKSDPLNSLGLAMIIMLGFNPMLYASGSFLLTCASVSGIVILHHPISAYVTAVFRAIIKPFAKIILGTIFEKPARFTVKLIRKAWDTAAVSISANIATLPIILIIYGNVSLLSPFANLLTVTIVMYTLILLIITLGISFIPALSIITKPLIFIISIVCRYTEWVAKLFGSTNISSVHFGSQTSLNLVIFILITFGALLMTSTVRRMRFLTIAVLCVTVPLAAALALNLKTDYDCKILVPNVGDGYCAIVVCREEAVIIGTGDEYSDGYIIEQELKRQSVSSVRAVIVPNSDNAAGSAKRIAKTYNCEVYAEVANDKNTENDQKNLSDLKLKLGEFNISALQGKSGVALVAEVYGNSFLFETYGTGEVEAMEKCDFRIASAGAAASQNKSFAENTVVTGSIPFTIAETSTDGNIYVLTGSGLINIPKAGEIKVLTNRATTYFY